MWLLGVVFLLSASSVLSETECPTDQKVIACYFSSWAIYREDFATFSIDNIEPDLCTHVIYAFSGLSIYGGIEMLDPNNDAGGYKKFVALKEKNPCLKTLLAIGGWNQGSRPYSVMVSDSSYRKAFIESVLRLLAVYGFDGIDIDWEYPTERGGILDDKTNFGLLLKELKEQLKKWDLLLTIAVPSSVPVAEHAYDLEAVKSSVDFVFIMGYDITPINSPVTGLISPMSEISKIVDYWTLNVPSEKIILGVPAYARTFALENNENFGLNAPTNGTGHAGLYTKENGFLSYYETIMELKFSEYTVVSVEGEENYYAYYNDQWITYETDQNYEAKAKYAIEKKLGGMMVWSIDTDDFAAYFNTTNFPIVNTIKNVLNNN
ncbi:acidic mammalian chitinase-like [Onthophagus taurus]|uniref:acidic mammalian chitinase-like n=1 Tax=Onthophagus taurus TaxID=166361 RepID=UPI000C20712A|nr:acidic mammalian chitinase-like [Onthophagus taurus]